MVEKPPQEEDDLEGRFRERLTGMQRIERLEKDVEALYRAFRKLQNRVRAIEEGFEEE